MRVQASMGYVPGQLPEDNPDPLTLQRREKAAQCEHVTGGPTADFSATPTSGRFPLTVHFTDLSQPGSSSITKWLWDFGEGEPSTLQNPLHTFERFVAYTVTLTVTDANGHCDTLTRPTYISVFLSPPSNDDKVYLAELRNSSAGMRAMIARHPTRSDFLFGMEIFANEGTDTHNMKPCGEDDLHRHWDAACPNTGSLVCDYNYDDPKCQYTLTQNITASATSIPVAAAIGATVPWTPFDLRVVGADEQMTVTAVSEGAFTVVRGVNETEAAPHTANDALRIPYPWNLYGRCLPLASLDVQHYIQAEFNTLCVNMWWSVLARKPTYVVNSTLTVQGNYHFLDQAFDLARGLDLNVLGHSPCYFLPHWTAYAAHPGDDYPLPAPLWADPLQQDSLMHAHERAVLAHCAQQPAHHVDYLIVQNEAIWPNEDQSYPGGDPDWSNVLKWQYLNHKPTGCQWPEKDYGYYWPWFVLSNPAWNAGTGKWELDENSTFSTAVDAFKDTFRSARYLAPDAPLVYNDFGLEFRYQYDGANQTKYQRALDLIHLMTVDDSVPLDAIGLQMHLAAWQVMKYDHSDSNPANHFLRLNPKQLKSLRDSVEGFGSAGMKVIITEMDVRMGTPHDGTTERLWLKEHLADSADPQCTDYTSNWTALTTAHRAKWQGNVYEAVLNACLAPTALAGLVFWDINDETSWLDTWSHISAWPNMPTFPDVGAARPCLFGDDPEVTDPMDPDNIENRLMYYPKPAYFAVRNAITNYFGFAFSVKDSSGSELVRFVENGNVLLMKPNAQVHVGVGSFSPDASGGDFIVKDSNDDCVAMVKQDGSLYLAGDIIAQADPLNPCVSGPSFRIVRRRDGKVVSLIDQGGNLRLLDENPDPSENANPNNPHTGYVLVYGLPYDLITDCLPNRPNCPENRHDYLSTDNYL